MDKAAASALGLDFGTTNSVVFEPPTLLAIDDIVVPA